MEADEGKTRISIPDDDAVNWIKIFQEIGMNSEEIDTAMIRLNDTYAKMKIGKYVDDEVARLIAELQRSTGKQTTEEQFVVAYNMVFERLRKIKLSDLERGIRYLNEN
ncbi:hypothetical protein HY967_04495 [Candidatus Jorgensenbacteria bacterium]|nr:hypothetical protein [Candidatus Jorgensenbacteria bacterium]